MSAILYLMNHEQYGRSTASAQYFLQLAGYLGIPVMFSLTLHANLFSVNVVLCVGYSRMSRSYDRVKLWCCTSGHRMERRQQRPRETCVSCVFAAPIGAHDRAPDSCDAVDPGEIQMASVQCGHFGHRRPRRLHTSCAWTSHCPSSEILDLLIIILQHVTVYNKKYTTG